MSEFDRRRDIEAEGQRALMVPSKPDLSNMGKSTAYKIGYRQGQIDALSAAMELPEVRALVEAARKMLVATELREIYHRLPNDKNRIGDPKSPKAKARDAWLKAFRRASSATSLALAAIKEPKT